MPRNSLRGRPICSRFREENEQFYAAKFESESDASQILSREAYSLEDYSEAYY